MTYLIIKSLLLAIGILLVFYHFFTGKLTTDEKSNQFLYKFLLFTLGIILIFRLIDNIIILKN